MHSCWELLLPVGTPFVQNKLCGATANAGSSFDHTFSDWPGFSSAARRQSCRSEILSEIKKNSKIKKAAEVCDNITLIHCPVPLPVYKTKLQFILV